MLRPSRTEFPISAEQLELFERARLLAGFSPEDLELLRSAFPRLRKRLPEMAEYFYAALTATPGATEVFSGPEQIARLKKTLMRWAEELFTDERDALYFGKRARIGAIHVELSIETVYIIGAMGRVREFLANAASEGMDDEEARRLRDAAGRAADLDLALMTESFQHSSRINDLEASQRRLMALLAHAPVAVFTFDRSGRIHEWNSASARIFGFTRAEIFGRRLAEVLAEPEDAAAAQDLLDRAAKGETVGPVEFSWRNARGETTIATSVLAPLPADTGGEAGVAFCLDMSELFQVREKMLEQEKLAAMGTLAAGLAHEVGNPLSSISAICQLVMKKGDDGKLRERMATLAEAIGRIDEIVRRVLDFARGGEDRAEFAVANEIQRVLELIRLDKRMKEIEWEVEIHDENLHVRAPRTGFSQVMMNMLLNAGESIWTESKGGRIRISVRARRDGAVVAISDSGTGFSEAVMKRAFEPFFSTKKSGSGLGLAISYGIVERAGGRITLGNDKELGGARIEIYLPGV